MFYILTLILYSKNYYKIHLVNSMKKSTILLFLFLVSINFSCSKKGINGEIISEEGNLIIVKIWGTHEERGFAYGYLLGESIISIFNNYFLPKFEESRELARGSFTNNTISIDFNYIKEAKAVVRGMKAKGIHLDGFDYIDLLIANSMLDLQNLIFEMDFKEGCSSLMSWGDATLGTDLGGKSVISRHLEWETDSSLINNQVVIVHIPSEKHEQPWLLIGFAGQLSVLSGCNKSGLGVFQHVLYDVELETPNENVSYEPIWFTLRKGLENKDPNNDNLNNVNDIKHTLLENNLGYVSGCIVTVLGPSYDRQDSLIALVAELAPGSPEITFRTISYEDSVPGDNLFAANNAISRNNKKQYCNRYISVVSDLMNGLNISSGKNWDIMKINCSSDNSIQFMQFIPEKKILKLAVSKVDTPAHLNDPIILNLDELFKKPELN